jgi:hypothetical protein
VLYKATLDPVRLLSEIRLAQKQLVEIADRPVTGEMVSVSAPTLEQSSKAFERRGTRVRYVRRISRKKRAANISGLALIRSCR